MTTSVMELSAHDLAKWIEDENVVDIMFTPQEHYRGLVATMLRQQQAEIERLIGAKPITYGMLTFCKKCGEQNPYPAKTLTDEEIIFVWNSFERTDNIPFIDFARAILRKAQEK